MVDRFARDPVPASAGVGLRHAHVPDFLRGPPPVGWIEIHSENYLAEGGPRMRALERIRRDFPLSCHGVGLSLGSAEGLDTAHLSSLKALYDRFEPGLISEHVAWSVHDGDYLNDLLPLPYTEEALDILCRNVAHAQEALGRTLLIENPSTYVAFSHSTIPEWEFVAETARRTGCGLLLDVNNVHVSAVNHGFAVEPYIAALATCPVGEIHVAGHAADASGLLIDDHGSRVVDAVWRLLDLALDRLGHTPVLVEWDTDIPALEVLLEEAERAQSAIDRLEAAALRVMRRAV